MKCKYYDSKIEGTTLFVTYRNTDMTMQSWTLEASEELLELIKELGPKINSLVFSSSSQHFCSGGNLKTYAKLTKKIQGLQINRKIRANLNTLAQLPLFKIACVEGDCLGGGLELLSCFDWVISTSSAFFSFRQIRIGLSFGWGGGARLSQRVSWIELKRALLTSETWSAPQALSSGLIDLIAPKDRLLESARAKINSVLFFDTDLVKKVKALNGKNEVSLFEGLWWQKLHLKSLEKYRSHKK